MDTMFTTSSEDSWLHGDFDGVIARLERDNYSGAEQLSDEQFVTLQARLIRNRRELLIFLRFLERVIAWYESDDVDENPRFERFVIMAPILRRDAMEVLPGSAERV